jgi:dihydroxyacetone synthase
MRACGWEVLNVADGRYDVDGIVAALNLAENTKGKPIFINIRTVIGVDMASAGTAKAHHGAFDEASITVSKQLAELDASSKFKVPQKTLDYMRGCRDKGTRIQQEWELLLEEYSKAYSELAAEFASRQKRSPGDFHEVLDKIDCKKFAGLATRETNGIILHHLWEACPSICGGGADLVNANKIIYSESDVFGPVSNYKGRYIRNGIREHAMASIANGMAAYGPGTFLPITATFFMFFIYAAPGVRMGALSNLQVIHIATHDSFGAHLLCSPFSVEKLDKPANTASAEGQNGPTHQPVELDSLFRAMPNFNHIRPCDAEELIGAWQYALGALHTPSMISVARDPVGPVPNTSRTGLQNGAYVLLDPPEFTLTLVSCGSALHYAVAAAQSLENLGIRCRLVSAPCLSLFDKQEKSYRESVFLRDARPIVSVEEYVATVWARYVTASIGMTGFGYSASNESNYARFGLNAEAIERKVLGYLKMLNGGNAKIAGWMQL